MKRAGMPIREIIKRMRHDGCGGRAGKVELMTGIDGASSRPVRKIVAAGGVMGQHDLFRKPAYPK
jgi:hypothetical protein